MKKCLIAIICSFLFIQGFSQTIVTDSVFIDFKPDSLIPFKLNISEITDNRSVSPKFISYSQKKKFILVPVDQEISTKNTLANELKNSFNTSSIQSNKYNLEIDYFKIEKYNGRIFNPYILKADIPVYVQNDTTKQYFGTLSYNLEYDPPSRKTPKTETCEAMLSKWHTQLKLDLLGTEGYYKSNSLKPERLLLNKFEKAHFLHIDVAGVVGYNFLQVEGELYFTRPETNQKQWFLSNIIRYQYNNDFEMIGFGKKSEHLNKRLKENISLDISTNLLLGLNKWKVTEDKTLYQLLNISLSSNQYLSLNKVNSPGWKLNIGLFENLYYIIGMNPKLQIGVCLGTGYKF